MNSFYAISALLLVFTHPGFAFAQQPGVVHMDPRTKRASNTIADHIDEMNSRSLPVGRLGPAYQERLEWFDSDQNGRIDLAEGYQMFVIRTVILEHSPTNPLFATIASDTPPWASELNQILGSPAAGRFSVAGQYGLLSGVFSDYWHDLTDGVDGVIEEYQDELDAIGDWIRHIDNRYVAPNFDGTKPPFSHLSIIGDFLKFIKDAIQAPSRRACGGWLMMIGCLYEI